MARKKDRKDPKVERDQARRDDRGARSAATDPGPAEKMKTKEYERELRRLHGELVAMQEWVKATGAKVCIVFEGRDTAGKGGTIKRITERVSPRVFKVVALSAPTEREKSQMYIQRYLPHFPAAGEVVIFDRSWYNRAGVERVMGFCTPEQTERFLEQAPGVEKAMVESGIILIKYWLEVSPEEQTRRLEGRINDPRKVWKLTDMDLRVLQPLGRLLSGPGRHAGCDGHAVGAVVDRAHGRQEAGPAQPHQPPPRSGPLRAPRAPGGQAAQAQGERQVRDIGPAAELHPHAVLIDGDRREPPRPRDRAARRRTRPRSSPAIRVGRGQRSEKTRNGRKPWEPSPSPPGPDRTSRGMR